VLKIENYKEPLEANRQSIVSLQRLVEDNFVDVRGAVEQNAIKNLKNVCDLQSNMKEIENMTAEMGDRVTMCESAC